MKSLTSILLSAIILGVGVGGMILFGQKPEVPTEKPADENAAIPVVTAAVEPWDAPFELTIDGEAATYRIVSVAAEVKGTIVTKTAAARGGTYIKKGDLLFEIDPTDYELAVDQLQAQLLQATEDLNSIDVDLENAKALLKLAEEDQQLQKKQLDRMKELLARRTANDSEVEAAMQKELASRNSLQGYRNQIRTFEQQKKTKAANQKLVTSQLRQAEADLKRCRIVAPLEGRVVNDIAEEGSYIKSGDPLIHISDGSRMEVTCQLRSEELAWVWQQRNPSMGLVDDKTGKSLDPLNLPQVPCEVVFEFEGVETIWDGYLARIDGTGIDRDTRTFPCYVLVEEPRKNRVNDSAGGAAISPPTLLSGMYVTIRVPVNSPLPLLRIPIEGVRPGGQVWVSRDDELRILEASIAHSEKEIALVRRDGSGFQEGDRVVVSPLTSVSDGMQLIEAEAEEAADE